nr:PREDICTED: polycomb protein Sfmbt-like [Bemisia tabaci]
MDMATRDDLGLVWMGEMLLPNNSNEMMMDHPVDTSAYFTAAQPAIEDYQPRPPMEMDGFMILEELEDPMYYGMNNSMTMMAMQDDPHTKMVTTSGTQTAQLPQPVYASRKIKPVKHPALKLQTPIAYQSDTDHNVIPIQPEGRGVCEKCGAIGVKHSFYTRERRYCSMQCVKLANEDAEKYYLAMNQKQQQQSAPPQQEQNTSSDMQVDPPSKPSPQIPPPIPLFLPDEPPFPPDKKLNSELQQSYNWSLQLNDPEFQAAPVSNFKHAPMSDCWDNVIVGMKVEVENTDCDNFSEDFPDSFWVASVLEISGYKALLRYEGFGDNCSKDFWVNLCSSSVHPVGWCATRGKPLIPPKTIENKFQDWKDFLVRRLTGARTLPSTFYSKVQDSMKSRFRCDLNLEVVDKNRISHVKVATIEKIVGKRLQLRYYDSQPNEDVFWCHEDSPLIHPVGWARRVGHTLDAPPAYVDRCSKGLRDKDDATEDLFPMVDYKHLPSGLAFQEGMKLEAIDPLNLSEICAATVKQVLNDGYLMIRVDCYDEDPNLVDWFCYHITSPCIFPIGFCAKNELPLTPPKGYLPNTFNWTEYLAATGSAAAPVNLFNSFQDRPMHKFTAGMKLEAADLMNPQYVCVATISRVVDRLLKVHFDGWEEEYDQWLDCASCDIYPVGWCELVSRRLEPPRPPSKNGINQVSRPIGRGRKRHKRHKPVNSGVRKPAHTSEQPSQQCIKEEIVPEINDPHSGTKDHRMTDDSSSSMNADKRQLQHLGSTVRFEGSSSTVSGNPEPETAMESVGPDQSLPMSTSSSSVKTEPPVGTKVSSVIPRLSDSTSSSQQVTPMEWDVTQVAEFLRINDCAAYCDNFSGKNINGKQLLELTKEQIIDLTGMKVGPSLKIFDLIQQLKNRMNPSSSRSKILGLKKFL